MQMVKRIQILVASGLLALGLFGQTALASPYGSGNYGSCTYGQGCSQSASSSPSGGTSSGQTTPSTPAPPAGTILLNDYQEYFSSGKSLDLTAGQIIYFNLNNEQHSITIKEIGSDYVVAVIVRSNPIEARFSLGQTQQFDVDGDGQNDIEIRLDSINDGKASMTFKQLSKTESPAPTHASPAETATASHSWLWIIISLAILLLGLFIFFILWWRRRRKQPPPPTTNQPS